MIEEDLEVVWVVDEFLLFLILIGGVLEVVFVVDEFYCYFLNVC